MNPMIRQASQLIEFLPSSQQAYRLFVCFTHLLPAAGSRCCALEGSEQVIWPIVCTQAYIIMWPTIVYATAYECVERSLQTNVGPLLCSHQSHSDPADNGSEFRLWFRILGPSQQIDIDSIFCYLGPHRLQNQYSVNQRHSAHVRLGVLDKDSHANRCWHGCTLFSRLASCLLGLEVV